MVNIFAIATISMGREYSSNMFAGWAHEKANNSRTEEIIRSTAIRDLLNIVARYVRPD